MIKPRVGGYRDEKLLALWLRSRGFLNVDRRRGASGVFKTTDSAGNEKVYTTGRDTFGCIDVIANNSESMWLLQVTTDNQRSARKRKVAMRSWPRKAIKCGCVRISVVTHKATPSAKDARRLDHYWRFDDLVPVGTKQWKWVKSGLVQFDFKDIAIKRKKLSPVDRSRAANMVRSIHGDPVARERLSEEDRQRVDRIMKRRTQRLEERMP